MVPLGREQTRSFGSGSLAVYFSLTAAGSRFFDAWQKALHTVFTLWPFKRRLGPISQHRTPYDAAYFHCG